LDNPVRYADERGRGSEVVSTPTPLPKSTNAHTQDRRRECLETTRSRPSPTAAGTSSPTAGNAQAPTTHTQKAAHAAARLYATKAGGGEIRIHGEDGRIRQSDTIAKPDPLPPRG